MSDCLSLRRAEVDHHAPLAAVQSMEGFAFARGELPDPAGGVSLW